MLRDCGLFWVYSYSFIFLVRFPAHQSTFEKGSALKGKNALLRGTSSFLLEKTLFQKSGEIILPKLSLLKVSVFPLTQNKPNGLSHPYTLDESICH